MSAPALTALTSASPASSFVGAGPLVAEIDIPALRANARRLRQHAKGARMWAVVKADAYGHGLALCARALSDGSADGFAVARTGEGVALRALGIEAPVLVMGGPVDAHELDVFVEHDLQAVVHRPEQAHWVAAAGARAPVTAWMKVDSGMTRLGLLPDEVAPVFARLRQAAGVSVAGFMTHFANADDPTDSTTAQQIEVFCAATDGLPGERMLSNSAGIQGWPAAGGDWIRAGLSLYGISPFADRSASALGLRPVMTLRTVLLSSKWVPRGTPVGYGGTWRCPADMPVGVAAIGYADGYPRDTPAGTPVLIDGVRAATIAPVSMDLLGLDLRRCPGVAAGARVTLWGAELPVEEVARAIGRIPYELVAGLGPRVVRTLLGDAAQARDPASGDLSEGGC